MRYGKEAYKNAPLIICRSKGQKGSPEQAVKWGVSIPHSDLCNFTSNTKNEEKSKVEWRKTPI